MADGVAVADVYKVLATKPGQDRAFAALDRIKGDIVKWKDVVAAAKITGTQ